MHKLLQQIRDNKELLDLEEAGFLRGDKKGKTMGVSESKLYYSLVKQWTDFLNAWNSKDDLAVLKTLADLRNNAGTLFLKVQEEFRKDARLPSDEGSFPPQ
jgi:hypothetical protein